jgi:hypothetical protein
MSRKLVSLLLTLLLLSTAAVAQRGHARDLAGEVFGQEAYDRSVKFIAGSYAPEIILTRWTDFDCTPETLNTSCFAIADPSVTTVQSLPNATRVIIPAKTLRDVLLIDARTFYWTYYRSDMSSPDMGLFLYQPTITIRSPALAAPITANVGHHRTARLIFPEEGWNGGSEDSQYTRNYRLTRSLMKLGMGMNDAQINAFFDSDITIELNLEVRAKQYDAVNTFFDLMIYGY